MAFTLKQKLHAWWEGYDLQAEGGDQAGLLGDDASSGEGEDMPEADPNRLLPERLDFLQMIWGIGHIRPGSSEQYLNDSKTLLLTDSTSVAEFGAGLGAYGRAAGGANICYVDCFEADPLLLDISESRPASAEERKFTSYNRLEEGPLPTGRSYHRVISNRFLHRQEDPLATLGEMKTMLKENGYILLNEYTAGPGGILADDLQSIMDGFGAPRALIGRDVYVTALEELGFDVRITEDRTSEHLAQIAAGWRQFDSHLAETDRRFDFAAYGTYLNDEMQRWDSISKALNDGQLEYSRLFAILK